MIDTTKGEQPTVTKSRWENQWEWSNIAHIHYSYTADHITIVEQIVAEECCLAHRWSSLHRIHQFWPHEKWFAWPLFALSIYFTVAHYYITFSIYVCAPQWHI